ncbi:MAG TPA: proton-conducting transporter membrane subunit [Terracidiphilus sp.]|nr:proton-conducting transporter membrane subunit [Terracidiphilus sp.]
MLPYPALPVALPLVMAALLSGLRPWLRRWVADALAILTAAACLGFSSLLVALSQHHNIVYWFGNWAPRGRMALGIGFQVSPVGAGLAALAALLTLLALTYSWRGMESGLNLYQPLMLIFLAAMSGFALTADLFNLFVFFELMSTAAFALCGLKVAEPAPLQGAFNFAITNTVGAFFILTGIALVYAATGALNMAQIGMQLGSRHDSLVSIACAFLISGFLIKAAIAPFHFWLPDAHSVAPTPVCVLFSGLMVELGAFAVLRISIVLFGDAEAPPHAPMRITLLALGSLTVIWCGLMCFAQHHLKRILAFSTISHAGAMLIGVAIGTPVAITGWLLYLFSHAMAKGGLFFIAGILLHRLRSMSEPVLHARGRPLKFTALLWLAGGFALAGFPPFGIGSGEDLIAAAIHGHGLEMWVSFLFFFTGALTAGAVFRIFLRVFLGLGEKGPSDRASRIGEVPEDDEEERTVPARLFVPALICIFLSAAPEAIAHSQDALLLVVNRFVSKPAYIHAIYGQPFTLPAAHLPATAGLARDLAALFIAALLACAAVYARRLPRGLRLATRLEGQFFPFRGVQSGHPGDYVVWAMVGFVFVGGCLYLLS